MQKGNWLEKNERKATKKCEVIPIKTMVAFLLGVIQL